ncbi:hypothetical protein BDZ89DRAFT_938489 [Hymenopellis radicata]|nr:hypothetical protein BDZ89DRAFT_938489 [Hymenopellis radicata]
MACFSAADSFAGLDVLNNLDHPLHPGITEVQLFVGLLRNGQLRLLFSSGQANQLRSWLHDTHMTKEVLPLPHSKHFIPLAEFQKVSALAFNSKEDIRNAQKELQRNNSKLNSCLNSCLKMTALRTTFERVRDLYSQKKACWIAIDFEEWELQHTMTTELGVSAVYWKGGKEVLEDRHYIISTTQFRNGKYVADNRMNYDFGKSKIIPRNGFGKVITDTFKRLSAHGPLFLVFHDASGDLKTLNQINAPIKSLSRDLPERIPAAGMFVVDTSDMFSVFNGDEALKRHALQRVCDVLQLQGVKHLHNAGNDAHFTMAALKAMVSGPLPPDVGTTRVDEIVSRALSGSTLIDN